MKIRYVGPQTGGLSQVGRVAVDIPHGEPVDLDDTLAAKLAADHPDDWELVDAPKPRKRTAKKAKNTPAPAEPGKEGTAP